jgi:hypothetical protein
MTIMEKEDLSFGFIDYFLSLYLIYLYPFGKIILFKKIGIEKEIEKLNQI